MPISRRGFVSGLSLIGTSIVTARKTEAQVFNRPVAPADPEPSARMAIKLDQNENPYGLYPSARRAATEGLSRGHLYPKNAGDLVAAIAKRYGVSNSNVLLAAGSGELLRAAVPAFVDSKRPLVAGLPTFETSTRTARDLALPVREVAVDAQLRLDLPRMEDAAAGAGLVFFCNPNNPTGTVWPTKECEAMIERLSARSPETVVLMDEAYADYVARTDYYTLAPRAAKDRRVLVTNTFSKIYGLAGMRIGYAIGHPDTLDQVRDQMTSSISSVSIAAALASWEDRTETARQVKLNNDTRDEVTRGFEAMGYRVIPSDANFVLIDLGRAPEPFQQGCRERGITIGRSFPGLKTHARISIGTTEEMRRAMPVFKEVLAARA